MDRRAFLGTISAATLLRSRLSWAAQEEHKIQALGVQLYSVRGEMKKDLETTVAKVAQIGYKEVEFAGLFDHSPQEVRTIIDRNGLAAPSAHVDYKLLGADFPKMLDAAHTLGQKFIVCPYIDAKLRPDEDSWKRIAQHLNEAAQASQKAGIQFAYHNHDFEFKPVNGKLPYDILLAEADADLVKMEMDLFWITKAGQDPISYFARYPGRFALVHVKDMKKDGEMTEVGNGSIAWKKIFSHSQEAGIQHYFVEHDEPKSPFDSIRMSYDYLKNLQF